MLGCLENGYHYPVVVYMPGRETKYATQESERNLDQYLALPNDSSAIPGSGLTKVLEKNMNRN